MFDKSEMLEPYSQPITIINKTGGEFNQSTGQWEKGEPSEVEIEAPVLPLSPDDLRFDELTYTTSDRKIYLHQHLDIGQKVVIDGVNYTVMSRRDYSHHANGLRIYIVGRGG